ncbi:MAG TPA: redoxin domain-containing protein [Campylobacterales bacterium]|nr:redoxin domain-containing protein [Campylobacterales bacterium]
MKILLALVVGLNLLLAQPISLPTTTGTILNMDITSNTLKVAGYEDKYIILEFFGKRCPVCTQIAPTISKLNNREDIQVIGVHMQDGIDDSSLNSFLNSKGVSFPVINYNQSYAPYALAKGIATDWKLQIPFMLFIAPSGQIVSYAMGFQSEDDILGAFRTYGGMK